MNYYRLLESTKDEINIFIGTLKSEATLGITEKDEDDYRFISKNILFLKELFEYKNDKDYLNLLIYSIFQMLYNSIVVNDSIEIFNLYKRIYIENLFRYLLSVKDTRESIRDMKDRLKEGSREEENKIIDYFYNEHKKSSGILHVNEADDINVLEYFKEISKMNLHCTEENKVKNTREIFKLLDNSTDILIIKKSKLVGRVFYNKMEVLEYLVGSGKCKKYLETFNI